MPLEQLPPKPSQTADKTPGVKPVPVRVAAIVSIVTSGIAVAWLYGFAFIRGVSLTPFALMVLLVSVFMLKTSQVQTVLLSLKLLSILILLRMAEALFIHNNTGLLWAGLLPFYFLAGKGLFVEGYTTSKYLWLAKEKQP